MSTKVKEVKVCDHCQKEIVGKSYITTEDIPNEGCSTIYHGKNSFEVGGQDYCCFNCLVEDIKRHLLIKEKEQQ